MPCCFNQLLCFLENSENYNQSIRRCSGFHKILTAPGSAETIQVWKSRTPPDMFPTGPRESAG